jgi:hypothetical protein
VNPTFQVTFDCAQPSTLAAFWAEALGYQLEPPPEGFASWEDWLRENQIPEDQWDTVSAIVDPDGVRPRLLFLKVPEGKTAKNRLHLDVNAGGPRGTPEEDRRRKVATAVEQLLGAGASVLREVDERGERWVVMADPEGNEFCLQ